MSYLDKQAAIATEEISRSLDLYRSTAYMDEIHDVVLSGGGSLVKGFANQLSETVGLEVSLIDPFRNIKLPGRFDRTYFEEIGPIASVAMGLAMRRIGDR